MSEKVNKKKKTVRMWRKKWSGETEKGSGLRELREKVEWENRVIEKERKKRESAVRMQNEKWREKIVKSRIEGVDREWSGKVREKL